MNEMKEIPKYIWIVTDWIYNAGFNFGVVSEGLGFNLCVAPFLNICVPNFELESVGQRWLEFGQRGSTKRRLSGDLLERLEGCRLVGYKNVGMNVRM